MAKTVIVETVDDLDGSPAAETVRFALDGRAYEIDLSADNAARLRQGVAEFVAAARGDRVSRPRRTVLQPQQRVIRDWATARGITVNARGRIPKDIVEQYMAAAH
ncbi:Lsr2 family protein [Sinomonas cellulolyticus]|uniref:Lsr2 family protein n=1 Tax=Sinomonas cellulolyticus TaxID=2801916 RepID=A0ABS1JXN9_9MICC|nr:MULTISPECIES: Lsr2 family protein [Sinomonas]MBL0703989.1 Lsr2 family protein [Sinomonas cellulolyticus]GHG59063.1 Lsr2 family protein [Sinomonas sp. KCTC 49339]